MPNRLSKKLKRIGAVLLAGVTILATLPAINVNAADGVMNYHNYTNAKQVYDSVPDTTRIYKTPDNAELFWATKSNKASNDSVMRYRTLGWRLVISGNGASVTCDLKLDSTIRKPMGEYESGGYYYIVYAIDLKTVYNKMQTANASKANTVYGGSSYHITAHPIMTTVPAGKSPNGSITKEKNDGTVTTSGTVYFLDKDNDYNAIKGAANWSSASYDAFKDFHKGRKCDISAMSYDVTYKIEGAPNTGLSNGFKTSSTGTVLNSNGSAYKQTVRSFAPVKALTVNVNMPGYKIDKTWKKNGTNYSVEQGGEITSYAIGGKTTLVTKVMPITYNVCYYMDGKLITNQKWTYDKSYNLLDGSTLKKNGYNFKHWTMRGSNDGKTYTSGQSLSNLTTTDGGTINFDAQWEPKEYEITLDHLGGTGGTDKVYEKYNTRFTDVSEKTGAAKKITSIISPKKYGYDFGGYFTGTNGTGDKFSAGVKPMLTPNESKEVGIEANVAAEAKLFDDTNTPHIVYAHYIPRTPKITFDKQGGTGGTNSVTATFAEDLPNKDDTSKALRAPTKEGWTFKGYYTAKDGKGEMLYNEAMGPVKGCDFEDNITVYAYWVDITPPTVYVIPDAITWTNAKNGINITVRMQDKGSGLDDEACKMYMDIQKLELKSFKVGGETKTKLSELRGETREVVATFVCNTEGIHNYTMNVADLKGNKASAQAVVYYDITAPTGTVKASGKGFDEYVSLRDLVNSTQYKFSGSVTDYKGK